MNTKYLLTTTALALLLPYAGKAGTWEERWVYVHDPAEDVFPTQQLSFDLFGTYADRDRFGNSVNHGGGGVGLNYFFLRYFGIGADTYIEEWRWPYRVNGSVILRLPLAGRGAGVAPYIFGGGGREFKYAAQYTEHVGGGVEFRFNRYTGLFSDYRRVFANRTEDYNLVRAGMRIGF